MNCKQRSQNQHIKFGIHRQIPVDHQPFVIYYSYNWFKHNLYAHIFFDFQIKLQSLFSKKLNISVIEGHNINIIIKHCSSEVFFLLLNPHEILLKINKFH